MVILKMTKPVSEEFECEILEVPPGADKEKLNLVRPCERYRELYKSCKSIEGRLHQYYVYGEKFDCSVHQRNYKNCLDYRKTKNLNSVEEIIEWEQNLIRTRLKTVTQNKAWKLRTTPPKDFEKPLPEFLEKRQSESIFRRNEKST